MVPLPSANERMYERPIIFYRLFTASTLPASRTLAPWEHLLPCPRCSFPCHVDGEKNVGTCSRQGCSMEFCTSCSSRPHTGPCKTPLLATPTKRNKRLVVGSRQSKRNLRRSGTKFQPQITALIEKGIRHGSALAPQAAEATGAPEPQQLLGPAPFVIIGELQGPCRFRRRRKSGRRLFAKT
uniref:ZBR-type domain-containing protein n=1 Tax=Vespula pensylvanica TaxID=30213 RepID=A0A834NXN0_VESPE|nr:hypothetical protein H0235_010631 [Vespula pensylvanica]